MLLIVCFFAFALTYALHKIFSVDHYKCSLRHIVHIIIVAVSFCGVCSLIVLAVLAGQAFYGRETADNLVKTVLLYVISGLISWISWRQVPRKGNGESPEEEHAMELENRG